MRMDAVYKPGIDQEYNQKIEELRETYPFRPQKIRILEHALDELHRQRVENGEGDVE